MTSAPCNVGFCLFLALTTAYTWCPLPRLGSGPFTPYRYPSLDRPVVWPFPLSQVFYHVKKAREVVDALRPVSKASDLREKPEFSTILPCKDRIDCANAFANSYNFYVHARRLCRLRTSHTKLKKLKRRHPVNQACTNMDIFYALH